MYDTPLSFLATLVRPTLSPPTLTNSNKADSDADIQPLECLNQLEVHVYKHKCAYLALLFILQVFAQR